MLNPTQAIKNPSTILPWFCANFYRSEFRRKIGEATRWPRFRTRNVKMCMNMLMCWHLCVFSNHLIGGFNSNMRATGPLTMCIESSPPRWRPVTGQPATPTSHIRRAILRTTPSPASHRPAARADPAEHSHYVVISQDGRKLVTRVRVMLP